MIWVLHGFSAKSINNKVHCSFFAARPSIVPHPDIFFGSPWTTIHVWHLSTKSLFSLVLDYIVSKTIKADELGLTWFFSKVNQQQSSLLLFCRPPVHLTSSILERLKSFEVLEALQRFMCGILGLKVFSFLFLTSLYKYYSR